MRVPVVLAPSSAGERRSGTALGADAAALAAVAAQVVPGLPVKFQFSMQDEFACEPYGPAMVADLEAGITTEGMISAWKHRVITDAHSTRPNGSGDRLMLAWLRGRGKPMPWTGPAESGVRNTVPMCAIPSLDVVAEHVRGPLRTGPLRSLGPFLNLFATESFMDELAEAARADPVEFRLDHLNDERAHHVLRAAADRAGRAAGIGPSGRGLGIAVVRYKDSKAYVAIVAEVDVDTNGRSFAVERIVVVSDAGTVIDPDGLRNQLEGGALQGLSRSLYEESTPVAGGGVLQKDWTTYSVLHFGQVRDVDVILIDKRGDPPLGAGESAPAVAAAVANALDDAVGVRLRPLRMTPERLQRRLMEIDEDEAKRVLL